MITNPKRRLSGIPKWACDDDRREFRSILAKLNEPTKHFSEVELVKLLCSFDDNIKSMSIDMAEQLLQTMQNWTEWISLSEVCISQLKQLWIKIGFQFPVLVSVICEAFGRLLYAKDFFTSRLPIPHKHCWRIFADVLTELSSLPQTDDVMLDALLGHLPSWRKSALVNIIAVANLLHVYADCGLFKRHTEAQKCRVTRAICNMIIDLELNPDGCLPSTNGDDHTNIAIILQSVDSSNLRLTVMQLFDACTTLSNSWIKLELLVWLFIVHLRGLCSTVGNSSNGKDLNQTKQSSLDWSLLCAVFRVLRDLFAQHILPLDINLHKTYALPLICFYTCSLRPGLAVNFVEFLWIWVKDECHDIDSRITALSYLTLMLTRLAGGSCHLDLAVEVLHELTTWCLDYTYRNRRTIGEISQHLDRDSAPHRIYYAVCDTVFYTIVQLHAPLLDRQYYRESLEHLPLAQILLSPLQPLLHSPPALHWALHQLTVVYQLCNANLGFVPSFVSAPVDSSDNTPTEFDEEMLRRLPSSKLYSLPFDHSDHMPFHLIRESVSDPLWRDYVVGQRFETNTACLDTPVRKVSRKRHPIFPDQNIQGVDVKKFARLVKRNGI